MKGTKYWNSMAGIGYIQTRSAIESIIHDHNLQLYDLIPGLQSLERGRFWLETCGTHSSANALVSIGKLSPTKGPGGWEVRPPDLLALFMNDPKNDQDLMSIDPNFKSTLMGNEFAKLYPFSVNKVFGFLPEYKEFKDWKVLIDLVSSGRAVQLCYINPGHFVCAVAYDETTDEIILVDPWPDNVKDGKWWNVRINKETYNGNVKPYGIAY